MVTGVLHFSIFQMTVVSMHVATGRDAILFLKKLVVDALCINVMENGIRFVEMTGTHTTACVTFREPNVLTTLSLVSTILEVAFPNSGLVRKSSYTYSKCWSVCGACFLIVTYFLINLVGFLVFVFFLFFLHFHPVNNNSEWQQTFFLICLKQRPFFLIVICLTHVILSLFPCLATARPTTLSKNELDEEDDLFGQLTQPTVATNEGEREIEETDQWSVSCLF